MKNPSYSLLTLCVLSFPLAFSVPAESREDVRDAVKRVANIKLDPLDAVTARADRIQDVGKDDFELAGPARLQENIETGATTDDFQLLQPGVVTGTEAKARPEKATTAEGDDAWQGWLLTPYKTGTEAKAAPAAKALTITTDGDEVAPIAPIATFATVRGEAPFAKGDVGDKLLLDGATTSKTEKPGRRVGMYGYPTIGPL